MYSKQQWWGLGGHMILRAKLTVVYATSRAFHARQVKGDDPDKKGYPGPSGWGLGVGPTTLPRKKRHVNETERETHNNICSYYNHYKHTQLTKDLIYLSFLHCITGHFKHLHTTF
jgi:hypothetical protein